ncbi:FtsX-like permease family protein [Caproiciproducens galactitolivorans]|uniref:ABC transporter permease n=1 Tax=Caproiciproducens galactitolivorans TaxID=642589 RepID=UPI00240A2DEC|nr:FtsX-like permease family protein [Caproiciproducens galactitolivorans]
MNSYLSIVPRYLSAHKKRSRLAIISVAISVALVTGIFSMLDALLKFEKIQVIHDYGNFHIAIENASEEEMQLIRSRIDVQNSGLWMDFGKALINGRECELGAIDKNFAPDMNIELIEGRYPTEKNELMLEQWAIKELGLEVNDKVNVSAGNGTAKEFVISGVYLDSGSTKASGIPGLLLSVSSAKELTNPEKNYYLVLFKDGIKVIKAEAEIKKALNIQDARIERNDHLLAVIGQSTNKTAVGIYQTGAILFCMVLLAGVMMIYNTFNISVMERVRQFGLLRCIGASRSQIKKMVKREGLLITAKAIPIGLIAGILLTILCSAILKYFNGSLFGAMPLFNISIIGIAAGVAVGLLTVFIACHLPAQKAASVSPINAIVENIGMKIFKQKKRGYLTKIFHVETAMGINNAFMKKKTLFLMSCSIAVSIIIFLGFQVFVDFMHYSLETTKPYTPDISLTSEQGLDNLYGKLSGLSGVKKVYGRMFGHVDATFDAARLTEDYKKIVGDIQKTDDGLFIPPEKSWLVSYDQNQLNWAKADLIVGELSEEKLNEKNGIIAVANPLRNGVSMETAALKLGDKVYIKTPNGTKEMTIMAILSKVPFGDSVNSLTTFVTTEKLFKELTGESAFKVIDIQLNKSGQEQTIDEIKGLLNSSVLFHDYRQKNAETNQTFLTMAVFIYGFVAVIALIGALNLINTMFTSVVAKTRNLGIMRAIGMSGIQLNKMVLVEALAYCIIGYVAGCILGIALQKALIYNFLPRLAATWTFPIIQIPAIFIVILLVTIISIISPLNRIKSKGIPEVIGSL